MKFNLEALLSFVRLIMTLLGTILIGRYFSGQEITPDVWTVWLGFALDIASLIWTIKSKTATIEMIQGVVRQALVIAGGFLVAKGWVTDATWASIVGLILAVIPYVQARTSEAKVRQLQTGQIKAYQLTGAKKVA